MEEELEMKEDVKESVENVKETIGILQKVVGKIVVAWKSKDYGALLKYSLCIILGALGGYGISLM